MRRRCQERRAEHGYRWERQEDGSSDLHPPELPGQRQGPEAKRHRRQQREAKQGQGLGVQVTGLNYSDFNYICLSYLVPINLIFSIHKHILLNF